MIRYLIIATADLDDAICGVVFQSDPDKVRKSVDGTKCIVKYDSDSGAPTELNGVWSYSLAEIKDIIYNSSRSEWVDNS